MPTEADARTIRRFYAALANGDLAAAAEYVSGDAVWHLPGTSPLAGTHRGWDAIAATLAQLGPRSGGTFQVDLLDVAVGEEYVIAVQRARATRPGATLDVTGCQLCRMRDGKIAEIRGHYSDEAALDRFWSG